MKRNNGKDGLSELVCYSSVWGLAGNTQIAIQELEEGCSVEEGKKL